MRRSDASLAVPARPGAGRGCGAASDDGGGVATAGGRHGRRPRASAARRAVTRSGARQVRAVHARARGATCPTREPGQGGVGINGPGGRAIRGEGRGGAWRSASEYAAQRRAAAASSTPSRPSRCASSPSACGRTGCRTSRTRTPTGGIRSDGGNAIDRATRPSKAALEKCRQHAPQARGWHADDGRTARRVAAARAAGRRRRRLLVAAAGRRSAGASGFGGGRRRAAAPRPAHAPPATATVTRQTLVDTRDRDGELGYGDATATADRLSGTVTWLPASGATVRAGPGAVPGRRQAGGAAVRRLPAYRDLAPGRRAAPTSSSSSRTWALGLHRLHRRRRVHRGDRDRGQGVAGRPGLTETGRVEPAGSSSPPARSGSTSVRRRRRRRRPAGHGGARRTPAPAGWSPSTWTSATSGWPRKGADGHGRRCRTARRRRARSPTSTRWSTPADGQRQAETDRSR